VELSGDELAQLADLSVLIDTTAPRYPKKMQKWIDR